MIPVLREAYGYDKSTVDEAFQKNPELLDLLDGLHFHTLCEQDSDDWRQLLFQ